MHKTLRSNARIDGVFLRRMLNIALPIMIQNLVASSVNMADTIMVGKLGEVEIAAVGIANQYFFFFTMMIIGISSGCSVFISQYWGKKDLTNIKRILGLGLISVLLVSGVFMAAGFIAPGGIISIFNKDAAVIELGRNYLSIVLFSYAFTAVTFIYSYSLRSVGNTIVPLLVNVVSLFINVFLNYVLIFGALGFPALGVEGAALATLISRVVETFILILLVYRGKGVFAARLSELRDLDLPFFKRSYRIILPVLLNDVIWAMASLIYSVVYGRMGVGAMASIQIANTVSNMFMVVTFGMASAASIMIGNSVGRGKADQTMAYAKKFLVVSLYGGIILGAGLAVTNPLILSLFNVSPEVKNSTSIILYIISFIFIIRFMGMVIIVGILRGAGDARSSLLIEGTTMWFIGVPLTILGAFLFKLPVHLVYGLAILEETAKFIWGLKRLRSRKWINNITESPPQR